MKTAVGADDPSRQANLVVGPDGFTESFSNDTVDLLVRMGLIEWWKTSSSTDWESRIYKATGRGPMKVGGE